MTLTKEDLAAIEKVIDKAIKPVEGNVTALGKNFGDDLNLFRKEVTDDLNLFRKEVSDDLILLRKEVTDDLNLLKKDLVSIKEDVKLLAALNQLEAIRKDARLMRNLQQAV
jgi:hypothetical protein